MIGLSARQTARLCAGSALATLSLALAQPAFAQAVEDNGEIVVTAAGFEQKITNAPASISVITREDLQVKRFGSLAEALGDVEGVDVGATAGKTGGLNISIRGMPSDYTLVLVDGRRQNSPGSVTPNGFGETSTGFLPPFSAIERIEVVRGPMSTLYGSDAMGGVINLITRKTGDRWVGTASGEVTIQENDQFGNIYSANAFAQGPIVRDLIGLTVRGSIYRREASALTYDNVAGTPVVVSTRGPSPVEADIYTYGGRLTLTPSADHDIWFEFDRAEQTYDNTAGQLGTYTVAGGYGPYQKFNRDNYVAAHTWRMGSFGSLETTLTRNVTETIGRTIPPGTPGKTAGTPRTLEATNSIADTRFVGNVGAFTFTLGGQYWHAKMIDGVAPEPYKFTQWALFAENELKIAETLRLTVGARYDDHSTFGGKLSPRGYLVWNATPSLTVKGGVSRGFKTPRLDQIAEGITGFGGQGTIPLLGSPGLTPETSTTYEAGIYFDDGGIVSGNVTVFNNDFNDKIASGPGIPNCRFAGNLNRPGCLDVGAFPNVDLFGQSINIDKATTRGGEVAVRFEFSPRLTLGLNYTYTESEQKSGAEIGQPLTNTPKHMVNGNLRWRPTDQLSAWVRTEIRSSRFRGAGAAQNALGDFGGYALFHLGGSLNVTEKLRFGATIFNLLDTDFVSYLPYRSGATTVYAAEYANNQEGRRLWLSATVDF
ncbi:TonB-dependent receptor [Sphingomonas sp. G-3-2-10]|uniref:TonB-dependent receptor domain-containing protein n=1 Tax=Sphingomonas sp. G-3-2-10 TaxID=2728838 RepID=UPI00146F8111|nr:TonB-dependent receptor [Sphingomonas sp. G-3-2-10]NML06940.1 TonB-dependent receptor [Sphingomonas sp. G-3-2-10]